MTNVINWITMANLGHNFGKNSTPCIAKLQGAQWFQMSETRRKCDLLDVIFPSKFLQMHITSVSGHCMLYIFKTLQIVAGTSMSLQFHDFLAGFWCLAQLISPALFTGGNWCIAQRCLLTRSRTIKILSHFFLLIRWDGLPEKKLKNVKQVEGKKWLTYHSLLG